MRPPCPRIGALAAMLVVAGCGDGTTVPADLDAAAVGTWILPATVVDSTGATLCTFDAAWLELAATGSFGYLTFGPAGTGPGECGELLEDERGGEWSVARPGVLAFVPPLWPHEGSEIAYSVAGSTLRLSTFAFERATGRGATR